MGKVIVSFPGIGIDGGTLSSVAFKIGDFEVYWYGVIITLGIITAFFYSAYRAKYEKIKFDDVIDMALWTVICGVVGARLYYVLTSLDQFLPDPFNLWTFIENVVNLRSGGLAIYGGIIGGATALALTAYFKKINHIKVLDMAGPGVMIAQAIGRWGNFFNGEAYGRIIEEGEFLYFTRMGLVSANTVKEFGTAQTVFVHPTFLYESLWNVCGFILINLFYKKKKFNGQIACMYLAWYGFGRMFIEGLRTDSLYIPGTAIRISQLVGALCFIVFGTLLVLGFIWAKKSEGKSEYKKIEKLLVPDIDPKPVFFEKKSETVNTDVSEEKTEIENTEEEQNGKDN